MLISFVPGFHDLPIWLQLAVMVVSFVTNIASLVFQLKGKRSLANWLLLAGLVL